MKRATYNIGYFLTVIILSLVFIIAVGCLVWVARVVWGAAV